VCYDLLRKLDPQHKMTQRLADPLLLTIRVLPHMQWNPGVHNPAVV